MEVQSQDWKKTETGLDHNQSGPENAKTDQDRNCGPVFGPSPFEIFEDRPKTGLDQFQPVFWALNFQEGSPMQGLSNDFKIIIFE